MTPHKRKKPVQRLRIAGLFAGIGGFEVGFSRAGHETSLLCELDPAASAVLKYNFPGVELVGDVREIDRLTGVDLLCAGFPCQDLSSVGQKQGIKGSQSSLVDEVFRILETSNVEWVILENVRFMLHLRQGEAMRRIALRLGQLGYRWAYRVLNSQAFGVPHRRHRVFLLASRTHDPRGLLLGPDTRAVNGSVPSLRAPIGFYWTEGTYATGLAGNAIPPLKGGSTIGIPSPPAILFPSGLVGTPDIRDAERLQGFDPNWTAAAESVGKSSFRWKLIGNAVTVPVAEWLGRRLLEDEAFEEADEPPLRASWPTAAWSMGRGNFASSASDAPLSSRAGLDEYLLFQPKPLSVKATQGFLRRAHAGNLNYPDGFLKALKKHSSHQS